MRLAQACELGGLATVAGGLWMLAPWLSVTFVGAFFMVIGVAYSLPKQDKGNDR